MFHSVQKRFVKVLSAAAISALMLTGCSGGNADNADSSAAPSGSPSATASVQKKKLGSLDDVKVSDNFGEKPTVEGIDYPVEVEETMSKVIVEGDGAEVPNDNATVEVHYMGINGTTGETFDDSYNRGSSTYFPLDGVIKGFQKGLVGKKEGSRVLIAAASSDGYDPMGMPQAKINPGDTLFFVVDVIRTEQPAVSGKMSSPAGFPKVSDQDGKPVIDIAGAAAPKEAASAVLVEGKGRVLADGDILKSHSVCTTWDGKQYYSDFGNKAVIDAKASQQKPLEPLWQQLVGKKEGSRVLVTLPGSAAYPKGNPNPPLEPNTSVACVVDILFTQPIPKQG